ncbi:MAG: phosphoribosylglycinamide formyltransferase, partial [Aestuariivirgaceae bacterium]
MRRRRVGILISGRGSNMEALIRAAEAKDYPAEIATVISNRPDAAGLKTAQSHGIEASCIDHKTCAGREAFEAKLEEQLLSKGVELIACAGFMRILSEAVVMRWPGRMINIHPSLLPSYPGLDTHARALADGVKLHGCTVHFVSGAVDAGPIIAQSALPVLPGDTAEGLAQRVLRLEHELYPLVLGWLAAG